MTFKLKGMSRRTNPHPVGWIECLKLFPSMGLQRSSDANQVVIIKLGNLGIKLGNLGCIDQPEKWHFVFFVP